MFFYSFKKKLQKSYAAINKDLQAKVFPHGEQEYIYVGTILNTLFKKQDIFQLLQLYASTYTYYKLETGNAAKTFTYLKSKSTGVLSDYGCKTMIGLVMLNTTSSKAAITDPIAQVNRYREFVNEYLKTVEGIKKNPHRFKTMPLDAGTTKSPILVDGIVGVRKYINALKIPGVNKISFERTSALHLTDQICSVNFSIDEYTLTNSDNGEKLASIWFNIYGTENTDILPACFSNKTPFSAEKIAAELFTAGIREWQAIEKICQNEYIPYNRIQLVIATFAYMYVVWLFSFKGIRAGQAMEVEEKYIDNFAKYNREAFENVPCKQVLDNEQLIKTILKEVDGRIRESYHANNYALVDDGLSDEYILRFVPSVESISKIKPQIVHKMMIEWTELGKEADTQYLT